MREPIVCQDGSEKNDCERVAAKRLCKSLKEKYPDLEILPVEDALYANAPHLRQIEENGWNYIINARTGQPQSVVQTGASGGVRADRSKVTSRRMKKDGGRVLAGQMMSICVVAHRMSK